MKNRKLKLTLATILIMALSISMTGVVFGATDGTSALKKPTVITLVSKEAGSFTITTSWDKKAKGYQVICSQKKNFSSVKKKTFKGNRISAKDVTGLKAGKKYYVKARAYKKNSAGKIIYSAYSDTKTVRIANYVTGYTTDYLLRVNAKKRNNSTRTTIPYMSKVKVSKTLEPRNRSEWVKLKYNGKTYYKYCKKGVRYFTAKGIDYNSLRNQNLGELQKAEINAALDIAQYKKTVYGNTGNVEPGTKDSKGRMIFDCSGFTAYIINGVMQKYVPNYDLSNGITTQSDTKYLYTGSSGRFSATTVCSSAGKPDFKALQPGDLVFFNDNSSTFTGKCDHVGIYLGKKMFVHAVLTLNKVGVMPMNSGRYKERFLFAKRFMPTSVPEPMNKDMVIKSRYSDGENLYSDYRFNNKIGTRLAGGTQVRLLYMGDRSRAIKSGQEPYESCLIEYNNGNTAYIKSTYLVEP